MREAAGKQGWRCIVAALWVSCVVAGEPETQTESDLGRQMIEEWSTAKPGQIEKSWDEETKTLTITQKTKSVAVNWKGTARTDCRVRLRSEAPDATLLIRATGGNPSVLNGFFGNDAEQKVVLVNPAGVVVGPHDTVYAGGLRIYSTLDISDGEFSLRDPETPNGVSDIGTIKSQDGDVILLGNFIENPPTAVNFQVHGNVYALAVNEDGVIRATGKQRRHDRVVLSGKSESSSRGAAKPGSSTGNAVLHIHQGSERAIIRWKNGVNFGEDEILQMAQPSKEAVAVITYENRPEDFVPPRVKAIGRVYFDNGNGTVTRLDEAGYGEVMKGEGILPRKQ